MNKNRQEAKNLYDTNNSLPPKDKGKKNMRRQAEKIYRESKIHLIAHHAVCIDLAQRTPKETKVRNMKESKLDSRSKPESDSSFWW